MKKWKRFVWGDFIDFPINSGHPKSLKLPKLQHTTFSLRWAVFLLVLVFFLLFLLRKRIFHVLVEEPKMVVLVGLR